MEPEDDCYVDLNPDEICRVCLGQGKQMKSIFSGEIIASRIVRFEVILEDVLGITATKKDFLPDQVCTECREVIRRFSCLKAQTTSNEELLRKIFKEQITEPGIETAVDSAVLPQLEETVEESLQDFLFIKGRQGSSIDGNERHGTVQEDMDMGSSSETQEVDATVIFDGTETGDTFEEISALQMDNFLRNETDNLSKCRLCAQEFTETAAFVRHHRIHGLFLMHYVKTVSFSACSRCHSVHTDSGEKYPSCLANNCLTYSSDAARCGTSFNLSELHADIATASPVTWKCPSNQVQPKQSDTIGALFCDICEEYFKTGPDFAVHFFLIHKNKYTCVLDECGLFHSYQALSSHQMVCNSIDLAGDGSQIRAQPEDLQRPLFFCRFCKKCFTSQSGRLTHERIHQNEKPFQCTDCEATFREKIDLTTHVRIHTGEKPFKCELCKRAFKTYGQRRDHMNSHATDKSLVCVLCKNAFKTDRTLKQHMKLVHILGKRFQCSVCQRLFHRAFNLKNHLKMHAVTMEES